MTKSEILEIIKLLSALEAVGVLNHNLPDYLSDRVVETVNLLTQRLLEKT